MQPRWERFVLDHSLNLDYPPSDDISLCSGCEQAISQHSPSETERFQAITYLDHPNRSVILQSLTAWDWKLDLPGPDIEADREQRRNARRRLKGSSAGQVKPQGVSFLSTGSHCDEMRETSSIQTP